MHSALEQMLKKQKQKPETAARMGMLVRNFGSRGQVNMGEEKRQVGM